MDKVFIKNLHISTIIGVHPHESLAKQEIIIDLEITLGSSQAALTDDINYTVDYDKLVNWINKECDLVKFKLLETLAEHLCSYIIKNFAVQAVQLSITKPNAITATRDVGVIITRLA